MQQIYWPVSSEDGSYMSTRLSVSNSPILEVVLGVEFERHIAVRLASLWKTGVSIR